MTTYGETKGFCRWAADLGDRIADAIIGGAIVVAQVEPLDKPDAPAEWTGSKGRPDADGLAERILALGRGADAELERRRLACDVRGLGREFEARRLDWAQEYEALAARLESAGEQGYGEAGLRGGGQSG